jgi:hypothetical protein
MRKLFGGFMSKNILGRSVWASFLNRFSSVTGTKKSRRRPLRKTWTLGSLSQSLEPRVVLTGNTTLTTAFAAGTLTLTGVDATTE